jgi:hypothetical protein
MNDKRKNITGANAPVIFSMLVQLGITMRNDTLTLQDIAIPQQC